MVKLNDNQSNLVVVISFVVIAFVIGMMFCKTKKPVQVIQKEVIQNDSMIDVLTGQNIALNNHIHNLNLEIQMYRKLLDKNKKEYDKEIDFIDGLDADEQLLLLAKNIDSIRYQYMSFGE